MRVYRLIGLILIGTFVLVGLISLPFLSRIQAVLMSSPMHSSSKATPTHIATPTQLMPTSITVPVVPTPTTMTAANTPQVLSKDSFQRADSPFWGTASDGQKWGADANTSPNFAVKTMSGHIMQGSGVYNATLGPRITDAEVVFSGSLSKFQPDDNIGAVLRWVDTNNLYKAYIDGSHLILLKIVSGTMTTLASVPFVATINTSYTLRFRVVGSQLLARVWQSNQGEPAIWMVQAHDTALSAGFGGLRIVIRDGNNATITAFTELAVSKQN